jgi:hypothetical protein
MIYATYAMPTTAECSVCKKTAEGVRLIEVTTSEAYVMDLDHKQIMEFVAKRVNEKQGPFYCSGCVNLVVTARVLMQEP